MWLVALYLWGSLLSFSSCDSCPEPEDSASWVKLKPLGHCEDEENFCPYRITLPPLSIQLPRPFRELEKMAKELQNLKEVVNRLRRDCQECKERQRVERGGWKDHSEEEERRPQGPRHNISSTERQSHNPNGEQVVQIVTSTLPQENTPVIEEIIMGGVINHSGLERRRWNIDRRADADQGTIDGNSEMSREIEIFDPSLEETPGDISEVKQVFSSTTEETESGLKFQRGELLESSIPKTKDVVQSATHGTEMSREVKIFNPLHEETPRDTSELKHVFPSKTEETESGLKFQQGELLESTIPRTKDSLQSASHGKQQPNILRERNVKNISSILAARRRMQNVTNANGLSSISRDANTKTMDSGISAGNRRIVNFSRPGGPLRPKTYINSRAAKVSDEDRLRNPAVVRTHPQAGHRAVKTGTGFSPVRSGVMRVKETSRHTANPKPGTNSGLTPSTEDEEMTIINPKPGTNSEQTTSTENEEITIIIPKPGTNSGLTSSREDEKRAKIIPKPGTNSGLTSTTENEERAIIIPKPGTNNGLTSLKENEKSVKINPKPGTNSGLTSTTEDEERAIIIPKPGTNNGLTSLKENEKSAIINPKPGTNSELTSSTEDEKSAIIHQKPGTNNGLTFLTENENIAIIIPKPGTNNGLTSSTEDEKMAIINPKPSTNSGQTPITHDKKMVIVNTKAGANSRITPLTHDEKMTKIITKPGTKSGLTPSIDDNMMAIVNPKPGTNSRITPSTHDEKMTNKEDIIEESDLRTDYENNLKDARQVTMDGEENFRKPNETVITRVPTNLRKEDHDDVSHTLQKTNKSMFSVTNRAELPNLIKVENEHLGFNLSLGLSSKADIIPSAGKADSSSSVRQVENEKYLTSIKETETINGQEDLGSTVLERANSTFNEKETNPLTPHFKDQTQSETFIEAANEKINYNSLSARTVKKDILSNTKATLLEIDLVNPTPVPSVKITLTDHTVGTASKVESPVVGQGTRRISMPSSISQPIKAKSGEDVVNIHSLNSKKNISKIRDISNIRFLKNITRTMPNLPKRPGRLPTTVIPSGGTKLNMINKMSGNRSVLVHSNFSISGRNSYVGRRNNTVMTKPSYVRRKPNFQTEPNASNQNRGFKTNVSTVTQPISPTGETSTIHTEEAKDIPQDVMGSNILDNHRLENTTTGSKSLPDIASRNAGDVQDLDTVKHSKDHVGEHSSETVLTSKAVNSTEDSNNENSLQDSLHSGAPNSLSGDKERKQFTLGTTDTSSQHPLGVDKFSSMKKELKPQNSGPTASTLKKELSRVNEKTQPFNNTTVAVLVTVHGKSTKHIPAVTNTHAEMVKNISKDTASTPISFENTVATRELELIKLNEDKVQKYSGDILSNPNSVDNVQGNNGERYTIPVVLETLTNVEEIKGSKVFSLSPEDTADGFKAIAVSDEVTQKDPAENKIHSTCINDCDSTPTQQPTTQTRPPFNSERGRGLPQDCADYSTKTRNNGLYRVRSKNSTFYAFCDMETSGGGWTLIQQRFDGSTSFNRTWDEYKRGFGKLMGEFWLGNDKIHWLTSSKNMSLRIELEDFDGITEYAEYHHFHVANESQRYRLSIGGYSGTAGNAMQFNKQYNHDQMFFTTPDRDNDQYPSGNCGTYYSSGWWFDACMSANLNGKYYHTKYKGVRNGIFWGTWHNITMEYYPTNERQSFKTVKMMIRPQSYAY